MLKMPVSAMPGFGVFLAVVVIERLGEELGVAERTAQASGLARLDPHGQAAAHGQRAAPLERRALGRLGARRFLGDTLHVTACILLIDVGLSGVLRASGRVRIPERSSRCLAKLSA